MLPSQSRQVVISWGRYTVSGAALWSESILPDNRSDYNVYHRRYIVRNNNAVPAACDVRAVYAEEREYNCSRVAPDGEPNPLGSLLAVRGVVNGNYPRTLQNPYLTAAYSRFYDSHTSRSRRDMRWEVKPLGTRSGLLNKYYGLLYASAPAFYSVPSRVSTFSRHAHLAVLIILPSNRPVTIPTGQQSLRRFVPVWRRSHRTGEVKKLFNKSRNKNYKKKWKN